MPSMFKFLSLRRRNTSPLASQPKILDSLPVQLAVPATAGHKACEICLEMQPNKTFPLVEQVRTIDCEHSLTSVCYSCLLRYSATQVPKNSDAKTFPCIFNGCDGHIPLADVQYHAMVASQPAPQHPNEASESWIRRRCKACPKCRTPIFKEVGCQWTMCAPPSGCGHQFCFYCTVEWQRIRWQGASAHDPSCQLYQRPGRHSISF